MNTTRVDENLLQYHHVLMDKPQIEKTDIQNLMDAYREKFDVDLVFAAERMIDNHMVELTQFSCRDKNRIIKERVYYDDSITDENCIKFDADGLCTCDYYSNNKENENAVLHYGIFHNDEYIGSVGILDFHKKREWTSEERYAVQKLGRVLKSGIYLNRITRINAADQDMINQQDHALESFFATTECGILRHTLDGNKIFSINKAALQLLDYSSKEELEKNFQMVAASVVEEEQKKLRAAIRKLKKAGDRLNVGYQVRHKNGELLDIMCRIKLIEEDGQLICQRVLMDCTEQRLYDKKMMQKREKHWNEIVSALSSEYSSTFFLDTDTGMGVAYRFKDNVRSVFASVMKEDKVLHGEIQELYIQQYIHPEDRERFREETSLETIRRELTDNSFYYVTYRVIQNNRTEYFQTKIVRVGTWERNHGAVVGFRSVDKRVRDELEHKRAMSEALKLAEEASKAKTSFLNNMSHDIRTPMNAIIGYTTLAKTHCDAKDQVLDYLDKISTSSNHLLNLINNVLDMSRIESGKFALEYEPCNLIEVMEDLNTVMSGQFQDKQLKFQMDIQNVQNKNILCDKLRLDQMLLNILGNAVKFTPAGGEIKLLLIQLPQCKKEGCAGYQLRIRDNGIGMSQEFQEHLFEQFSRENSSTVSGISGTGLGMAITRSIVEMMEGEISVWSKPGEGTEFTINLELPICAGEDPVSEQKASESEIQKSMKSLKLLLVEDNALNQEIATEILSDCGFQIEVANDGSEAVEIIKNSEANAYDAILMDIQMPVMNGYEATERIRMLENNRLASIPIIAMTANAFEEDRRRAISAGMNGFVTKPIDVDKLMSALASVMDVGA